MPTEILMPALSPTMEEGTLAKWLVKEGDSVASGDIMAEIETDKATMEFEAVDEGVIGKILVAEGTAGVAVNTAIAVLLEDGESADDIGAVSSEPAPKSEAATPAAVPVSAELKDASPAPAAPATSDGTRIFASPLARRIAADKGLDLSAINGSGPRGRIVKADVENATAAPKSSASAPAASSAPTPAAAPSGPSADAVAKMYADRDFTEVPLDGMRKTCTAEIPQSVEQAARRKGCKTFGQRLYHQSLCFGLARGARSECRVGR